MLNTVINVSILIIWIILSIVITLALDKIGRIQIIAIFTAILALMIADKVLVHYFYDYFKAQWYYIEFNSHRGVIKGISGPYFLISGLIFYIIKTIKFKRS